jgi:ATP-binding cassette, subfamily B, bacterial
MARTGKEMRNSHLRLAFFHPKHFGRALRLAWDSSPQWILVSLGLVIFQSALPLLSLYLYKLIIDAVEAGISTGIGNLGHVIRLILLALAGALTANALQAWSSLVGEMQAFDVTNHMSRLIQEKSTEVDLAYYENPDYHDTLHRAQQEAGTRPIQIVHSLTDIVRNGLSLILLAGLLFSFHWSLAFILVAITLPGVLFQFKYANCIFIAHRRRTHTERKASYVNWMLTSQHSAREIRLFNLGQYFRGLFRSFRQQLRSEQRQLSGYYARVEFFSQVSSTLALYGAFTYMSYRTLQGEITLGTLVVAYQAYQQARGLLQDLIHALITFYQSNLFLSNVYEFLDLEQRVADPQRPRPVPKQLQRGLVFEGVSFQYPGSEVMALEKINLSIEPGKVVALVGENGSGKTTLVKLLCRFYDPTEGRITLDGVDLRDYPISALRQQMSVIFQDYIWYHLLTARENIWIGNVASPADDRAIIEAASQSGADEFIRRLPHGYDNILGNLFEKGRELSIGQWQKVALARAFYRRSAIIVLDEPSSALDPMAEAEVFSRFRQLTQGQTAVLISHRLSNIKQADCIYVLGRRTIAESGKHNELMQRNGLYQRLFEAQAQHYR